MLDPWRLMGNLSCPEVAVGWLGCIPVRTGLVGRDQVGQEVVAVAGYLDAWTPGCS